MRHPARTTKQCTRRRWAPAKSGGIDNSVCRDDHSGEQRVDRAAPISSCVSGATGERENGRSHGYQQNSAQTDRTRILAQCDCRDKGCQQRYATAYQGECGAQIALEVSGHQEKRVERVN
jgi:hypothetical protein